MEVQKLLESIGADFYTGVPDSRLKPLYNYLMETYGIDPQHHLIGANEGNCAALAAGYHLATGKVPVVYLQNSGEGNLVNPVASLLHREVYGIPMVFLVGWRGEPGVHDEPQHRYQGQITLQLLEDLDIASFVIDARTTPEQAQAAMETFRPLLAQGRQAAFVIKTDGLHYEGNVTYRNDNPLRREEIIRQILRYSGEDPVISTTGKASRELFELRSSAGTGHQRDFLTVGSMGHSSSIALGVALQKPDRRVWCIDGDGAALMHLGAMALIGSTKPANLIHVIVNNGSHESVGGPPTAGAGTVDLAGVARACGYPQVYTAATAEELDQALEQAVWSRQLTLIEVRSAIGARPELGRPTVSPIENKNKFMGYLD